MSSAAVDSALAGIATHRSWFDASAGAVSRVGLSAGDPAVGDLGPVAPVALAPGSGELVDAIVGSMVAGHGVAANTAVLRTALDMERSLVDVLA